MKKKLLLSIVIILVALFSVACDKDDPASPSSLAGSYVLVSMQDKGEGVTLYAGQPTDYLGVTMTINGTLTLTETNFTMSFSIYMAGYGTENASDAGTYSCSGNQMTITSGGESGTYTYTFNGTQLVMDSSYEKLVWNKQ